MSRRKCAERVMRRPLTRFAAAAYAQGAVGNRAFAVAALLLCLDDD